MHPSQQRVAILHNYLAEDLIQSINMWCNVADKHLNILAWNQVAERVSGYSAEEVIGHPHIWEWLYPEQDYRNQILDLTSQVLVVHGRIAQAETRMLTKGGDYRMITWYSRPLLDTDGQVSGFITFGLDDTERKLAENGLQQALAELHVLYEIASITNEFSDLSHLLDRSLERILAIMQSRGGVIHLWDEEAERLVVGAARGAEGAQPDAAFVATIFDSAEAHYSPPFATDPDCVYIGVPMRARGQAYGTISIIVSATEEVGHDETALLTSIADQIGIAVENARLNTQAHQLAVAEERRRLARDLHDSVTQSLYSLTLFAEAGQRLLRSGDVERVDKYLERLSKTAQDALREMRLLLYELRPYSYESGKLAEALQQRLDAVERRSGLTAHLITGTLPSLPAGLEDAIYHVALEALNNSLKHAFASAVTVRLDASESLFEMEVVDNGAGFAGVEAATPGGMGLTNMHDRAYEIGATLEIDTRLNEGTTVRLRLPLNGKP